jgi:ribonuclease D
MKPTSLTVDQKGSLVIPSDLEIKFVGREHDIPYMLSELMNSPYIGMDCEWKPTYQRGAQARPALMQISNKTSAFLIDMVALAKSKELDKALCKIF